LFFLCAQKDTRIGDFGTTAKWLSCGLKCGPKKEGDFASKPKLPVCNCVKFSS
jgi:hypothetical protein